MLWQEIADNFNDPRLENPDSFDWYDPSQAPFAVEGLNWFAREKKYMRFAEKDREAIKSVSEGVYWLCANSAGGQIRFVTDAADIAVAVRLAEPSGMDHFAATGESGTDVYLRFKGEGYLFEGVSRFDRTKDSYVAVLAKNRVEGEKEAIVNLPLYASPLKVYLGLSKGAAVKAPAPHANRGRVVVYGTSITQGGCASRPGMLYTNILSRRMDREFVNFGFSGNGMGEKEVAHCIEQVTDPALYVLAYEANAGEKIKTTMDDFIAILRGNHPVTPILVMSRIPVSSSLHEPKEKARFDDYRDWEKDCVQRHKDAGDRNIHFLDGRTLMPGHADECFVDGVHPTDLGFAVIADNLQPVLEKLL